MSDRLQQPGHQQQSKPDQPNPDQRGPESGVSIHQGANRPGEVPWQALLDSAGEGIWGVDLEGRCTFVNRAALSMLGFTADDLLGKNMHTMIHHHRTDGSDYPVEECNVYNVFRRNEPFANAEDHLFRSDGTRFSTEMSAQPILEDGVIKGAVVTFRDITKTKQAEDALRRSEKLAAVGQLASSIAHEINNPLEAVINLVYLIKNSDSLAEAREFASLAESELGRVSDIVLQTLRFHRHQSAAAPVDLADTLHSILKLYTSRMPARKIEVSTRLRDSPQCLLLEGDIRQVLNNLIRNAFDAMPQGGTLHLRLRPATCFERGLSGVRLSVGDTGTGFSPQMQGHVFEPFHTTKEVTGTGLGLWISKGIIDNHQGRIRMRSRSGRGTVFSIFLPLKPEIRRGMMH